MLPSLLVLTLRAPVSDPCTRAPFLPRPSDPRWGPPRAGGLRAGLVAGSRRPGGRAARPPYRGDRAGGGGGRAVGDGGARLRQHPLLRARRDRHHQRRPPSGGVDVLDRGEPGAGGRPPRRRLDDVRRHPVIDTETRQVTETIPAGDGPWGLVIVPYGKAGCKGSPSMDAVHGEDVHDAHDRFPTPGGTSMIRQ